MHLDQKKFENNLSQLLPDFRRKKLLVAVSGGADSMVLVNLLLKGECEIQVAHINYKLRGKDSDDDQKLVEKFCKNHQVKLHVYEVSDKDHKPEKSVQLWARNLRYDCFFKILAEEKLDFIVTAHHLSDELETFLINLSRGSGIKGLSGIPAKDNRILRPLLQFSKEEIYAFAKKNKIDFREDLSNQKNDYLRNFIRNEITPRLLEIHPAFLQNFEKSLKYLKQTEEIADQKIQEKIAEYFNGEKGILSRENLKNEHPAIKFGVFKKLGFMNEAENEKMLQAKTGSQFTGKKYRLTVNRNELIYEKLDEIKEVEEEIALKINSRGKIIIPKNIESEISTSGTLEWIFDQKKLNLPLKLRHQKEGDVFFPVGMEGSKKVSKFFKDEKLSILAKPKIWLLVDAKDDVLGILPMRRDRRFAADKRSEKTITLNINKG